ncbi:MAG: DNA-formamidopyrimidine glycosylase, partial [Acidobacteriota bacterium]|nr:DNA-formamidopyrimidine glycosylase [Acidobacteriota bacterium]
MPELPEVESVVRALDSLITGRQIQTAALYRDKLAPSISPQRFEDALTGASISQIARRGKYILITLGNGETLLVHLRMSGRFQLFSPDHENPKFTHAEFFLDGGERLTFSDQRHFGYMNIVPTRDLVTSPELRKLAPEPFSEEFSKRYFREVLSSSRRSIKELLLDQTKVCGLGNIYAS